MTETIETTGRRETPWARLVLSVDAPRTDWLAARRHGITATDLPAILGQSKYKTAIDVWTDKVLPAADKDDDQLAEAAFWGIRLEEPVAQAWAEKHGVKVRRVGLVANDEHPWMMASLDRIVQGCPDGRCALEVKTRSLFVADSWERELPQDVRTQVLWQLLVTGLDHIHVAALIGGQRLVEHRVNNTPDVQKQLIDAAQTVWTAVQNGTAPDMPATMWTDEYLEARHPDRAGEIEVDAETVATLSRYQDLSIAISALEDQKKLLRTQLVGALGEHEVATSDGTTLYSYKSSTRRSIDTKALKVHYPDIESDDNVWSTTTTRTLRVSTKGESK